jgi:hypothetical protein
MSREQEKLFRGNPLEIGKHYNMTGGGDHGIDPDARPFIGQDLLVTQLLKSGLYITKLPDGRVYPFPKSAMWPIEEETYDYLGHRSTVTKTVKSGLLLDAYHRALDTRDTTVVYVTFEDIEQVHANVEGVFEELEHSAEQLIEILEEINSSVVFVSFDVEDSLPEIKESLRIFTQHEGIVAFVTPSLTLENAIKELLT